MKHLLTLLLTAFVFAATTHAQTPQLLNYQGVARNGFGNALPNRQMTLRLSIRNGSSSGTIVYSETRTVTTNSGGLYSVQIGSGGTIATTGSIATINWQVGTKFLQVEVDPDAGTNFIDLGTTQLVSVPYAMSAGVATPVGSAGGDLTGTYPNPTVANSAVSTIKLADAAVTNIKLSDQSVTTTKLADASVTDAKIVTVAGSKVTGNISGNAANVTGTVSIANGGTGATTAAGARTNLGLGNVDNTSDLNKPISTATQAALDLKENLSNKSTATTLGNSDDLYPTQKAVKTYVDGQIVVNATPDATATVKGKVQLAGDLTGTAAAPEVATGAISTAKLADASVTTAKIADAAVTTAKMAAGSVSTTTLADGSVTDAKIVTVSASKVTGNISGNAANVTGTVAVANGGTGATTAAGARTNLGLGNVDNTSDLNKPISTATQAALDLKENLSNKSTATTLGNSDDLYPTQKAVKTYVDGQIVTNATPDATSTVKGKVQLAGDLTGTAAAPAVAAGAISTAKLADASVTDAKIVTVSASKVTGNISGNATNVTGTVAIANGGTGATTAAGARTNLGLGNVDNTSDLNKPISTATQAALDLKIGSLNGLTSTTQTFATGTSGTDFAIASSGSTHTINIPSASASARGLVTTGAQTFAGNKEFKGNLTVSRLIQNEALDQSTSNIVVIGGTGPFSAVWQSFTAGVSGVLSKVSMQFFNSTATGTLYIYQGTGINGTLLTSQSFSITAVGEVMIDFPLEYPVNVNSTSVYTMAFIANSGTLWESMGANNSYTRGVAYYGDTPASNSNTLECTIFKTFVSQAIGGSLTVGQVTYPSTNGTAGQVLVANANGTASWANDHVTGTVGIANGGTGATTAAGARTNLGLGNVDNTSDLNKPISTATQAALNLKIGSLNGLTSTTQTFATGTTGTDFAIASSGSTHTINIPSASTSARGLVTTGTQSFAGNKEFKGNLTVSRLLQNEVLDQSNSNQLGGTGAFSAVWQSFTAGVSGVLSKVSMQFFNSTATGTLYIYQGTGINGTLLTSQSFSITAVGDLMIDFPLENPVNVNNGSVYTMAFIASSGTLWEALGPNNSYTRGVAYFGNAPASVSNTTGAMLFKTFVSQEASGGTLTVGRVTYPNTNGTAGQVLVANANGTASWADNNVSGIVSIANGGTGQSTLAGVKSILGLTGTNVAIASQAGLTNQGTDAIAIGSEAGKTAQDNNTIAIGSGAGRSNQGLAAISIGYVAGDATQGSHAIAIGGNSAQANQATRAVAIGYAAGQYSQGTNAIAIGSFAGNSGQIANSIALNATGGALNPTNAGFYVNPIRNVTGSNILFYDATTKEVTYGANSGVTTIGSIGSSSDTKGATISGTTLSLTPADATNGGIITTSAQTIAGDKTFTGAIRGKVALTSEITANLTINSSNAEDYNSKILICNPTSGAITITFNSGLPAGFNCMVLQKSVNANKINIAAGSGITINNRNNYTATAGQYALATIVHIGSNVLVTAGDMQ